MSRLLKLHRETGDLKAKPRGGNNPRRVELTWLRAHLERFPDARIVDRIEDWVRAGGRRVNSIRSSSSVGSSQRGGNRGEAGATVDVSLE